MKKLIPLIALIALACITFMSCRYHHRYSDRNVTITYTDDDEFYSMNASFNRRKIREVERYINRSLEEVTNMSFVNSRLNGRIALDDNTIFYIKKYPGHIKIRLNKYENSEGAYQRIRSLCEGIEDVLIDRDVVVRVQ